MKQDECDLIVGKEISICKKRLAWIHQKWVKKGWYENGKLTEKGKEIVEKVKDVEFIKHRVVIVYFKKEPPLIGVIDWNDYGYYLITSGTIKQENCWGHFIYEEDIAYIELHERPNNIWRKLNYLWWKVFKEEHGLHNMNRNWIYDNDPNVKVGECYSDCQCKYLKLWRD